MELLEKEAPGYFRFREMDSLQSAQQGVGVVPVLPQALNELFFPLLQEEVRDPLLEPFGEPGIGLPGNLLPDEQVNHLVGERAEDVL